jgi:hypothetical protein
MIKTAMNRRSTFCATLVFFLLASTACGQAFGRQRGGFQAGGGAVAPDIGAILTALNALDVALSAADTTVAQIGSAYTIRLADNSSTTNASSGVAINGNSITISAGGTYALSGTLSNGQVIVDTASQVNLILNGVNITSRDGAPLAFFGSAKKIITLAAGTQNTLADAATYTRFYSKDEPNGALFSKKALTINGSGSLTVNGNYNNGISCKDNLKILGGTITVSAVNNAIKGNDSIVITGGNITVNSKGDGLNSDSTDAGLGYVHIENAVLNITAVEDAIQAYRAVHIKSGTFTINAGDDGMTSDMMMVIDSGTINILKSVEGIEGAQVIIRGGTISLVSSDDGINASDGTDSGVTNLFIAISGGNITVNAGGDGIDANGTAIITDGVVTVHGPTSMGNSALDADRGILVNGGLLIAAGPGGRMAQTPESNSTQYSLALQFNSTKSAGTVVSVKDAGGKTLAAYTAAKQFQLLVISSPDFVSGGRYSVYVGNTLATTCTVSDKVTSVGL